LPAAAGKKNPKSFLPPLCGGRENPREKKSAEGGQKKAA